VLDKVALSQVLCWTKWHWDRFCVGQSGSGTGFVLDKVALGQVLCWTKWHWDRFCVGQSGTGIVFSPSILAFCRRYRIPMETRFSAPVQTDPGAAHTASCKIGIGSLFRGKSAGAWR
jgi:hypothetical protein